jgi:hypothetical protein
MVIFALLLPLFLAIGSIVITVGNWYVHKRHLQTQVDAAAFSGAHKFVGCSFQFGDPNAANDAIKAAALAYAGDTNRVPTPADTFNLQEQQPADVHVVLNSARYWAPGDDITDGIGLDYTMDPDSNPLTPGDPCTTKTLDVKATDDEAPLLWRWLTLTPSPKTKARVEIQQIKEQSGMLPWAVPDIEPAAVAAIFVDENTGAVVDWQLLMKDENYDLNTDLDDNPTTNPFPLAAWVTPEPVTCPEVTPGCVPIPSENTGIVILLSKVDDTPLLTTGGPGTLTTICDQAPGLVACYAGDGDQDGLTFIHGWSDAAGSSTVPQIRDVNVLDISCSEDLSAPYFLRAGECSLGARAVIDFGLPTDPTLAPPDGISAQVTLSAPGCGPRGCPMSYSGQGAAPNESIWETTNQVATIGTEVGRTTFTISTQMQVDDPATPGVDPAPYSRTFAGVAHPYVADEDSGPVEYLALWTADANVLDPNSRNVGPERSVIVAVGLRKPLRIEDPLAPPILLRVASPSGSRNQAFDCDRGVNFENEIENGCQTTYGLNYDDWSVPKDGTSEWADILCEGYDVGDLPPAEFVNEPAPICVAIETGDKIGQFRQGLKNRFETPTCWPNAWPKDEDELYEFFTTHDWTNDPRYVTLVITDFTAFLGQGNDQVPVKYFAGFYAMGWDKVGNQKPCLDNAPHPWYGDTYRQSLDDGDVWGHFVNIVVFSAAGKSSEELCNFDEIGNCIAVLVE